MKWSIYKIYFLAVFIVGVLNATQITTSWMDFIYIGHTVSKSTCYLCSSYRSFVIVVKYWTRSFLIGKNCKQANIFNSCFIELKLIIFNKVKIKYDGLKLNDRQLWCHKYKYKQRNAYVYQWNLGALKSTNSITIFKIPLKFLFR